MNRSTANSSEVRLYRFGVYELDLERNELRKFGQRLKIERKPMQLLVALLDRSGAVVTRGQLQELLWDDGVFVDFEKGLTVAATKLRAVLNDSPEKPKYIATVAGAGYQFIAAVEKVTSRPAAYNAPENGKGSSEGQSGAKSLPALRSGTSADLPTSAWPTSSTGALRKAWKIAFGGALLIAGLFALKVSRSRVPDRLSEKDTIVLADFVNSTGDAVFDDALKTAVGLALSQSPFLNLLPESKVAATLQMMMRPATTKLSPEIVADLCQRVGSKAYIRGTISNFGSGYVLTLKAVNCQTGDVLAQEQVTASGKEKILNALGGAASKLRGELGESLASVKKFDAPLEQVTTPSLEALKAYSRASAPNRTDSLLVNLSNLQRAVELDPNFATAYLLLGEGYDDIGASQAAQDCYTKAFQLREHATEPERLAITVAYYANVTGELEKAAQMIEQEMMTYPRAVAQYGDQSFVFESLGRYDQAMELTRQNLQFDPVPAAPRVNAMHLSIQLQRFDEAREWFRNALSHKVDNALLRANAYYLAFLTSDSAGMAEQQEWFANHPDDGSLGFRLASDTEAYAGHLSKANELTMRSINSSLRMENKDDAATGWEAAAVRDAAFGRPAEARRDAEKGLSLASTSRGVEAQAAFAFALAGDTGRSESLVRDINKRWPLDTQIQSLWLPTIHAQLALDRNKPRNALNSLQAAYPVELGFSCLYSTYVRGEAYLAVGQGRAAADEFQRILDHSGIVSNCWTGALARLGLARANTLQARTLQGTDADAACMRALAGYENFFTLWKDADPNVSILKQAKAEYAKLR